MIFKSAKTLLLISLFLTGSVLHAQNLTRKEYIEKYKDLAIRQMKAYGIPASIILAQACLESGNGNSRLAVRGNNHFGIKCHNWKGKTIRRTDDEKGECFRKYDSVEDSFRDHSDFLRTGKRYQSLFDLKPTDYRAWAHGLKACGYATAPRYATMLIEIIEKNQLYKYDYDTSQNTQENSRAAIREAKKKARQERRIERENKRARRAMEKAQRKTARNTLPTGVYTANPVYDTPEEPILPAEKTQTPAGTENKTMNPVPSPTGGNAPEKTGTAVGSQIAQEGTPLKNSSLYNCSLSREIFTDRSGRAYILSSEGDTYRQLAKEYNLFKREILKFNGLSKEIPLQPGTIVYITKKKK